MRVDIAGYEVAEVGKRPALRSHIVQCPAYERVPDPVLAEPGVDEGVREHHTPFSGVLVNDRAGDLSIDESVVPACFSIVLDIDFADHEDSPGEERLLGVQKPVMANMHERSR